MKKSEKILTAISFFVMLVPMLAGVVLWNRLPEELPIHYNFKGEADNYAAKWFAVVAMPLFLCLLQALCLFVSYKITKQAAAYSIVLIICPAVSLLVGAASLLPPLGIAFDAGTYVPFFLGILFCIIGNVLPKISRNKTMGIKLPWTLKNDTVWNRTHRLAGFLWFFGGIAVCVCAFLPAVARVISVSAIFAAMILVPTVYSYYIYKKK